MSLRLETVDTKARCITLLDSKSGRQMRAVGAAALIVLDTIKRSSGSPWVFPATRGDGHLVGLPKVLDHLYAAAGIDGATVHTLRHAFASVAADEGFSEMTVAALLGHARRGVTQRYAKVDRAAVLAADAVSSKIKTLLDGQAKAEVVQLPPSMAKYFRRGWRRSTGPRIKFLKGKATVPRKAARPPKYDIPFVGYGINPVPLGWREKEEIRRTLKRRPSDEFLSAYGTILAHYIHHHATVIRSTPAAVQMRMEAVLRGAKALQKGLNDLGLTDKIAFGRFATRRVLKDERYTELDSLSEAISYFLPVIEEAVAVFKSGENRGRPPAYAERALATDLGRLLHDVTGQPPTAQRGGMFDCLLQNAFAHASRLSALSDDDRTSRPRKDVVDLLRLALRAPLQPLLSHLADEENKQPEEE